MEIDAPEETNGSSAGAENHGLHLYPVYVNGFGEGLPYAPVDFPNPGDKWTWKVGKRIAASGHFLDRYLYLPNSLQEGGRKKGGFASRLSVEQYVRKTFPGADVNAFFASFSWKIPSTKLSETKGIEEGLTTEDIVGYSGFDSQVETGGCRAGNRMCSSSVEGMNLTMEAMFCDICCSKPRFCRDCCCILCYKTVDLAYRGYSFIRCEAPVGGFICGHIAHVNCGLRSYMAGTVGGSIGLDCEYFSRRCDSRTDLILHVEKLLHTCKSIQSRDEIKKILNVGICILRGSQKTRASHLLHHIEMAMVKLKSGTHLEDVWKMEDISVVTVEPANRGEHQEHRTNSAQMLSGIFDCQIESSKLEDEIDQVLLELKKSQDYEYKIAEERLHAQKDYVQNLFQHLSKERSEHSRHKPSTGPDALLDTELERVNQIKREVAKFRDMEEVSKGFGRTSKNILKDHFGLEVEL